MGRRMQVGYENIVILDIWISGFGIDHCWTVACHQHFDGPV